MDEVKKADSLMTSPAAFVEGGIQDACDDACSICLEAFNESDPSTVTCCKHEFHLQCVLEWCQRSSNCPMCWQPISLKDQISQELFDAVEQERNFRVNSERNATLFHLPLLENFELQHLPVGVDDTELEERIFQHLAAAASMGRTRHLGRREGSRNRSSAHDRPQFVVFSTQPNSSPAGSITDPSATTIADPSLASELPRHLPHLSPVQNNQLSASSSGSLQMPAPSQGISFGDRSSSSSSLTPSQGRAAGSSDFQSLSETWKSRFSSLSMKYKESLSKNTRGWKEKLFSRSSSMPDRKEVNPGIASLSNMMEHLGTRENSRAGSVSTVNNNIGEGDHGNMVGAHIGNGSSTGSTANSAQN